MPQALVGVSQSTLYERLVFLEKNPDTIRESIDEAIQKKTAEVINISSDKWIDLIEPIFYNPKNVAKIIEEVGFIPEEIFTKKKFKSVKPEQIIASTLELRRLEETRLNDQALHERAKIINHLFISRRAEPLRAKERANVTLDSNGISINLIGFYSHLPYGLISNETIEELARGNWLDTKSISELNIQKAKSNSEFSLISEMKKEQDIDFDRAIFCTKENFLSFLKQDGGRKIAEYIVSKSLIIPDGWIESAESEEDCIALLDLAEQITALVSGELLNGVNKLSEYSTIDTTQNAYIVRSKVLNSPDYYNVTKIVKQFLLNTPQSSPDNGYAIFRGRYKKIKDGDQHSFVGALHNGKLARVLINERKHIGPKAENSLSKVGLFERDMYEKLEDALRTFNSFSLSLSFIEKQLKEDIKDKTTLIEAIENCLHFLLNNVSNKYSEAVELYDQIIKKEPFDLEDVEKIIAVLSDAKTEYSKFLYKNIPNEGKFETEFSPEIHVDEIQFGASFIEEAERKCPGNFDVNLSKNNFDIRVVSLDYRLEDPSETIPFHTEESCLDALRIDRNRPLINIIGGCKHLDTNENPLATFGEAVVKAAHKYRANVGIPCTQSGIGITFGEQNILYSTLFNHLPHTEKAHFFAISPGGSVYFPDNKFMDTGKDASIYANTTVDTLVTPLPAEWNKRGLDKYTSKYITHIAYMEALYQRMSAGQRHIMVVGNGGLYSIMEINESLKKGVDLILLNNSGRFAEAASHVTPYASEILASNEPEKMILDILSRDMETNSLEEFLKKDFGKEILPENDDYVVYRDYFRKFLRLIGSKKTTVTSIPLDSLEGTLDKILS